MKFENLKHSKGPWYPHPEGEGKVTSFINESGTNRKTLATVSFDHLRAAYALQGKLTEETIEELKAEETANLKLICAAPELLEALIEICNLSSMNGPKVTEKFLKVIKKAIE